MYIEIIRWLPLIVAFIAGGFALHQIRTNNITNARIKWLEILKQTLTDFLAECVTLQLKQGLTTGLEEMGKISSMPDGARDYYNKLNESTIEHLKIVESKYQLIKLNLNPKEKLHQKLEKFLDDYMKLFNEMPIQKIRKTHNALTRKMSAHSDTIVLLVRYVMKIEWEKTKRPYFSRIYFFKFSKGKKLLREAIDLQLLPERQPNT